MSLFIIAVCFSSIFFVSNAKRNLYTEKIQFLREISLKCSYLINDTVTNRLKSLETISKSINQNENSDINSYISSLKHKTDTNEFKKIGIISLDGQGITTDGYTYDFSKNEYFKDTLTGKNNISDMVTDIADKKEINIYTVPIKNNNEIKYVLFATQDTDKFDEIIKIESFNGEAYSYIIKKDGTPVVYPNHKNSFGKYNNLFNLLKDYPQSDNSLQKLKDSLEENINSTFNYQINGKVRYGISTDIGINDWHTISVVPEKVLFNSTYNTITSIAATASFLVIGVIVLSWVLIIFFKKNNKKLQTIAFIDNITGYSNWNKFEIDCTNLLKQNQEQKYSMITFDIERFKVINDIYGHLKGDEVLKNIADIIMLSLNEYETFSRISADNFNILMCYENIDDIVQKIYNINKLSSCLINGYNLKLYFGIYKIEKNSISSISALSDRAKLAKLTVKGSSKNYYSFFDEQIRKSILFENEIENCMDWALKNDEFQMFLQPKFEFKTGQIVGAEALVRWNREKKGIVCPDSFIPLFEKNGFVSKLDKYMFEKVCILLSRWAKSNNDICPISISVNFSRLDLTNATLPKDLLEIAKKHNVNPEWIEIEITESAVFNNTNRLIKIMQELKDSGFTISIDDFGSGYSSLNILKDLPANVIKMDKEFLSETTNSERGKLIIISLIQMSQGLGLSTVAEGVETINQANFLKDNGCDIAQGYYYAKPMPVIEFEKLLNLKNEKSPII